MLTARVGTNSFADGCSVQRHEGVQECGEGVDAELGRK